MLFELGVLWIFLALLSGHTRARMCGRDAQTTPTRTVTVGQGPQRAISPLPAWRVDRDDHS